MQPSLYLASRSPRRQELLRQMGIEFEVFVVDVPEHPAKGETAEHFVTRMAQEKSSAANTQISKQGMVIMPILGADTCVVIDGEILGKPRNRTHGIDMLRRLSGTTHEVMTAVNINADDRDYGVLSLSKVSFDRLSDQDVVRYWDSGEPMDKAGGYGIQGRAAAFISRLEGSYTGVVGLPLFEVSSLFKKIGIT
ncbi:MAG TPA: septum formation inhibitor Maf [Acidiferrobacteraceae bacterium]|nr:septum formation inhibitor Maf [Acidiferrobacteraceae bacterium]